MKTLSIRLAVLLVTASSWGCASEQSDIQSGALSADGKILERGTRGVVFYKVANQAEDYEDLTGFAGVTSIEIAIAGENKGIYLQDATGNDVMSCVDSDSDVVCTGIHAIDEDDASDLGRDLLEGMALLPYDAAIELDCNTFWYDDYVCEAHTPFHHRSCDTKDAFPQDAKAQCLLIARSHPERDYFRNEVDSMSESSVSFVHRPATSQPAAPQPE